MRVNRAEFRLPNDLDQQDPRVHAPGDQTKDYAGRQPIEIDRPPNENGGQVSRAAVSKSD